MSASHTDYMDNVVSLSCSYCRRVVRVMLLSPAIYTKHALLILYSYTD